MCSWNQISYLSVMGDISWVNDTSVIRQNPRVTAINSAVEVDLSGQVVGDSFGTEMISGSHHYDRVLTANKLITLQDLVGK